MFSCWANEFIFQVLYLVRRWNWRGILRLLRRSPTGRGAPAKSICTSCTSPGTGGQRPVSNSSLSIKSNYNTYFLKIGQCLARSDKFLGNWWGRLDQLVQCLQQKSKLRDLKGKRERKEPHKNTSISSSFIPSGQILMPEKAGWGMSKATRIIHKPLRHSPEIRRDLYIKLLILSFNPFSSWNHYFTRQTSVQSLGKIT